MSTNLELVNRFHINELDDIMTQSNFQQSFKRIEKKATKLPWANEKLWTAKTHIWNESDEFGSMLVVDLHDLSLLLAGDVINKIFSMQANLDVGCLCFITGVGQHSATGPQIRPMAIELCENQADQHHWQISVGHPGRVYVIIDPERTPSIVIPRLTSLMTWSIYTFVAILVLLLLRGLFSA